MVCALVGFSEKKENLFTERGFNLFVLYNKMKVYEQGFDLIF